ncbi:hypothetical protein [Microbacterium aurum]
MSARGNIRRAQRASARRSAWRPWRKLVAGVAAAAVVAAASVVVDVTPAEALTLQAPQNIYQETVNGDYLMVGNGVLAFNRVVSGLDNNNTTANRLHNGESGSYYNDYAWMGANTVAGLTGADNGSSANVTIPAGAAVVKAALRTFGGGEARRVGFGG